MCHENKFKTKQGQKIDANGTGTDFFSKYNINQKVTLKKKKLNKYMSTNVSTKLHNESFKTKSTRTSQHR